MIDEVVGTGMDKGKGNVNGTTTATARARARRVVCTNLIIVRHFPILSRKLWEDYLGRAVSQPFLRQRVAGGVWE